MIKKRVLFVVWSILVLEIEPRALYTLDKGSTTEPYPQPFSWTQDFTVLPMLSLNSLNVLDQCL